MLYDLWGTTAHVELPPEHQQQLMYRAEALRLLSDSVSFVKKKKPSSSLMTIERQSKKVKRTSFHKETRAAAESAAMVENIVDVTPAVSGPLRQEADSTSQFLEVAMGDYCFIKDTSFSEQ